MTSCSNTSRRQITPYVRRLVAATRWGDTSQRQIASCVLENFCENLCLRNRILSLQQVAKNQIRLNLCDLLRQQNSVAATKIFTKILQYTRSDLLLQCVTATCCWNLSPSVYRPLHLPTVTEISITSFLCNNASLQRVDENCVEALGPVTQILMSNVTCNIWISAHWSPDIGFCNKSLSESFVRKLNIFFLVHAVDLNLIHAAHRL